MWTVCFTSFLFFDCAFNSLVTIWFEFEYIYYRFVRIMQGMAACKHPQGREEEKEEEEDEEGGFHTGSRCVSSFENKYWKYFSLPVLVWVDFILDLYKLSTIAAPRDLKLCFKRKEKEKIRCDFFFFFLQHNCSNGRIRTTTEWITLSLPVVMCLSTPVVKVNLIYEENLFRHWT